MGALIREAIDTRFPHDRDQRARAVDELLALEPMPVEDWDVMKRELAEGMWGSRSATGRPAKQ